ncbi:MAG: zinc ABC transporter permease subunit ZnuB [Gammaproteobacteria bacterium]
MDNFLLRAALGGIGIAIVAAALGVFVVWRRMAYFGDTLAHSALLGVALGLMMDVAPLWTILLVTVLIASLLLALERGRDLSTDTFLGILSHSALSLGLVALAFMQGVRVDLMAYLFGDILALSEQDLWVIWIGVAVVLTGFIAIWRPLLASTVHADLARVEGVPVDLVRYAFMLLLAVVIGIAMKLVGVLLITALLIIPAATARRWASGPEQMALIATIIGVAVVLLGLAGSLRWDTPAGPSVVVAAAFLFGLSRVMPGRSE